VTGATASWSEGRRAEISAVLARYPADRKRAAVMPLLFLAQRDFGHVTPEAVSDIARLLELDPTQVGGLIRFYTLFRDRPGAAHRVQVCTDLPCALRGAEVFARELCQRLGIALGGTTSDGIVAVEEVMCLAACDRAPVFQVQSADGLHYHEGQTVDTALQVIGRLRERDGRG
jgi:NADH-quinone oxidoreductase subunit E